MATGFTPERIERALAAYRAFWRGQTSRPLVSIYHQPTYRQAFDDEKVIAGAVECIRADAASGAEAILPTFWPDFGTISTAKMWGGRVIPPEGERCIHIAPVAQGPDDLARLRPGAFEESDFQKAADLYRRVCDRLETDQVFIRTPDVQGPMNTLALLMDQTELMCALYEAPDAIGAMLDRITDVLIETVRRFIELIGPGKVIGNIWPFVCLPAEMGLCITQDYLPLLSAEHWIAFERPRLKRIADAFGGVFIHCCGDYARHLRGIREGGFKVWGLEMAYPQTTPMQAYEVFGEEAAYLVGVSPDGAKRFPTLVDYARYLAAQPCARGRFWFASCWDWCDAAELRRVVEAGFGRG